MLAAAARPLLADEVLILDAIAALGLTCFLAWFISGLLETRIKLQEAARKVVYLYDRWADHVVLYQHGLSREELEAKTAESRERFRVAVAEYSSALSQAHRSGWEYQGAVEMARAELPIDCSGWIDSGLRLRLRRYVLYRVL